MSNKEYVHIGCGHTAPPTWTNFDASPTLRLEQLPLVGRFVKKNKARFPVEARYGNIVHGLPVEANSVKAIFACHVFEHLALEEFRTAIRNVHSYLMPGGIFRIVVPSLEAQIRNYVATFDTDPTPAHTFVKSTHMGREVRPRTWLRRSIAAHSNAFHLWGWDQKTMTAELAEAGFTGIRRCAYHDSSEPLYEELEWDGRFTPWDVPIECRK